MTDIISWTKRISGENYGCLERNCEKWTERVKLYRIPERDLTLSSAVGGLLGNFIHVGALCAVTAHNAPTWMKFTARHARASAWYLILVYAYYGAVSVEKMRFGIFSICEDVYPSELVGKELPRNIHLLCSYWLQQLFSTCIKREPNIRLKSEKGILWCW